MNCDEYKEAISADPHFDGGAAHLSECAACQDYRREMLELDEKIKRALAISVPAIKTPELAAVETDNVVSLQKRRRRVAVWYAAAASVVVAAMVVLNQAPPVESNYAALADEVLAHIDHEPHALLPTSTKISDDRLSEVVPANIANMDHSAGLITYAQTCPIRGKRVPHLVIQGQQGPITILLLPDEKIPEAIPVDDETLHGVILPVGDGSIAIVGSRDEKLEEVQKQIVQSVIWDT